jgi:hypothetical protein
MNSAWSASRSARASASASVSALGDSGHHQGLFVVPQSPPPSWSPPASANYQSSRAMDGDFAHGSGGGNAFQRLARGLRVLDFALAAVVWVLSRVILLVVDIHERTLASPVDVCRTLADGLTSRIVFIPAGDYCRRHPEHRDPAELDLNFLGPRPRGRPQGAPRARYCSPNGNDA